MPTVILLDTNKNIVAEFPIIVFAVKEEVIKEYSQKLLGHTNPCVLEKEMLRREAINDFFKQHLNQILSKNNSIFDFSSYNFDFEYIHIVDKN